MNKRIVVVALVLMVFSYLFWVIFPRETNPMKMKAHVTAAKERVQALDAVADDPAQNGWKSDTFLPYWGRKGEEFVENSEVGKKIEAWAHDYSSAGKGQPIKYKALLASEDSKFLKARKDFEALLPELQERMEKPYFHQPLGKVSFSTVVLNFIAVRAVAQATSGYAELAMVEGRYPEAADILSATTMMGGKLGSSGSLICQMIGIAIQAIAQEQLTALLASQDSLTEEQWARLSDRLFSAVMHQDQFLRCMELEVLSVENSLRQIRIGQDPADLDGGLASVYIAFPGVLQREERIYRNLMGDLLDRLEEGNYVQDEVWYSRVVGSPGNYLIGRSGVIASIVIPNIIRAGGQARLCDGKQITLATCAGLRAYRAKHGSFPDELDKLSSVGIDIPEGVKERLKGIDYRLSGRHAILSFEVERSVQNGAGVFGDKREWISVEGNKLHFKL